MEKLHQFEKQIKQGYIKSEAWEQVYKVLPNFDVSTRQHCPKFFCEVTTKLN